MRASFLGLLLLTLLGLGGAVPQRSVDVAALTQRADAIIVGRVLSVEQRGTTAIQYPGGSAPAAVLECWIGVDHVVKGEVGRNSLPVVLLRPDVYLGYETLQPGEYGVLFLKENDGSFVPVDPSVSYLPAVPGSQFPAGSPLDQVTRSLGQVLRSSDVSESDRYRAIDAMRGLHSELAAELMETALKSASGNFKLDLARSLVARNDIAGLPIVEEALLRQGGISERMVMNLEGSLSGLKDPRAVTSLARIADAGPPQARPFVAAALRQSNSPVALRPLARLLNDPDPDVRYYAVVGLGEITHQDEWTPARDEFQKHEARYIAHWREWADSNLK